eukprot:4999497-Prymnesium_polylepis.2
MSGMILAPKRSTSAKSCPHSRGPWPKRDAPRPCVSSCTRRPHRNGGARAGIRESGCLFRDSRAARDCGCVSVRRGVSRLGTAKRGPWSRESRLTETRLVAAASREPDPPAPCSRSTHRKRGPSARVGPPLCPASLP